MIFADYTFFAKKGADDGQSETHFILRIPYARVFGKSDWAWKAGLAVHQTRIKGEGGNVTLNNGNSFADFSAPGRTSTTTLFVTELGLNYYFQPVLSLQSSILIEAPLNSLKRNFSFLVGLNYEIGSF